MNIKIYTAPGCKHCHELRLFLKSRGLRFFELSTNQLKNAKEAVRISGQMGVPVIDINGQIIVGWNQAVLDKAISLGRHPIMNGALDELADKEFGDGKNS
ncbi:MAG: glutaredoxin domain-containing protein [Patescibacteria group bacterium]